MIYAYDEPVVFPTIDLYDSGMMGAYLTAAKDLYDKALEDEKDFLEKYGDFLSPITADVNYWYNDVLGPMYDEIDKIYDAGGDPLRNPIDRAAARQLRNAIIRKGTLPKLKLSAKAAEEYLKNRATLEAAGKYNPEYETMILNNMGLPDFEHWDSSKNGIWNRTSPGEFLDLNKYTSHIFDDLKDSFIGRTKDGKWLINGVNEQAMRDALTSHLSGIVGSDLGKWYYNLAKAELEREGNIAPSEDDIMKRLQDNIITANAERIHWDIKPDEFVKQLIEEQHADYRAALSASNRGGGSRGGGGNGTNNGGIWAAWDTEVGTGLLTASSGGTDPISIGSRIVGNIFSAMTDFAKTGDFSKVTQMFSTSSAADFPIRSGLETSDKLGNSWYTVTDSKKVVSPDYIERHTLASKHAGMSNSPINIMTNAVQRLAAKVAKTVSPLSGLDAVLTIPMEDGTVHQYHRVAFGDANGNKLGEGYYDYGAIGYLGYENKKGGENYNTLTRGVVTSKNTSIKYNKEGTPYVAIDGWGVGGDYITVGFIPNSQTLGEAARVNATVYHNQATSNSSEPVVNRNGINMQPAYEQR